MGAFAFPCFALFCSVWLSSLGDLLFSGEKIEVDWIWGGECVGRELGGVEEGKGELVQESEPLNCCAIPGEQT